MTSLTLAAGIMGAALLALIAVGLAWLFCIAQESASEEPDARDARLWQLALFLLLVFGLCGFGVIALLRWFL